MRGNLKQAGTQTQFKVVIFYKETLCVHVKFTFHLETESSFCKFPVQQITFDIKEYKRRKKKKIRIPNAFIQLCRHKSRLLVQVCSNLLKPICPTLFPPFTLNLFSLEFNTFDCKSPPPFLTEHGWYWIHDCIDLLNSNLF